MASRAKTFTYFLFTFPNQVINKNTDFKYGYCKYKYYNLHIKWTCQSLLCRQFSFTVEPCTLKHGFSQAPTAKSVCFA